MKYKVTVQQVREDTKEERYPTFDTVYEQVKEGGLDMVEKVIIAVNDIG